MTDYKRLSRTEWQWMDGSKYHAVRYFPKQGTLIGSAWIDTTEGPQFEGGFSQKVETFLEFGLPQNISAPQAVSDEIRALLAVVRKPRGLLKWLHRDQ